MDPNKPIAPSSESERFNILEAKINKIYESVEKTRKYFLWTMIITVIVLVLPIIGLIIAIPAFLSTFSTISELGL